ncbi:MAG: proline dehydrogenase family protein [Phycisphaerae bacterium]
MNAIETLTRKIGGELLSRARRARPGPWSLDYWRELSMNWSMRHGPLKQRLFRFVSLMPQQHDAADVARALREQLRDLPGLPFPLAMAIDFDDPRGLFARGIGRAARLAVSHMAHHFLVGSTPDEALDAVRQMRTAGMAATLDILGESVRTAEAAQQFCRQYLDLLAALGRAAPRWGGSDVLDAAPYGALPRANVSVKLSALSAEFSPDVEHADSGAVRGPLGEIFRAARSAGAFINVDMEHFNLRDATLDAFERLLSEPELRDWPHAGIVVQAYLRDSRRDLDRLIAFARRRGTPITVRLVKGAYWDYETEQSRRAGRVSPVWSHKWESDESFESLTAVMLENVEHVRPALGSHNVRSIAHALARSAALGQPARTVELQMLHGMGDVLKRALVQAQQRLRVYSPMGAWVPGVAYLVRRLMENTANESFLRQSFDDGADDDALLSRPGAATAP